MPDLIHRQEAIASVLRATGAGRPCCLQHGRTEVRICGSATTPRYWEPEGQEVPCFPCSDHLVRLSRKSQEREACTPKQHRAHWRWATSQSNSKPTAHSQFRDGALRQFSEIRRMEVDFPRGTMTQHGKDFPNHVQIPQAENVVDVLVQPTKGNALDDFKSRTTSSRHNTRSEPTRSTH